MTTTTTTKTPTVSVARKAMSAFRASVVSAYGKGRNAELELGNIMLEAKANGMAYFAEVSKSERKDSEVTRETERLSTEAAVDAINDAYGTAPSKQDIGKLRGFARVHGIAVKHDIGTEAQRLTLTSGACREVSALATEAVVVSQLKRVMANGQRPTAENMKAAKPATKGKGKGKGTKSETKDTKGKGTKAETIGLAEVRDFLTEAIVQAKAAKLQASPEALTEVMSIFDNYIGVMSTK